MAPASKYPWEHEQIIGPAHPLRMKTGYHKSDRCIRSVRTRFISHTTVADKDDEMRVPYSVLQTNFFS